MAHINPSDYSIGVVSYHARFDTFFKPLTNRLTSIFPDKEIICVINGHPNRTLQISYLDKVTTFLKQFRNVRYVTYDQHQSLAKCWNQLVILSDTQKTLIMNDDTQVTELFRQEFESKVLHKETSTINHSWSHFLVSKAIIKKTGWFDERLLGVGHEDADFALRMIVAGVEVDDTQCLGLSNFVAQQEDSGWKDISKQSAGNKYSQINLDFFKTKWITDNIDPTAQGLKYTYAWNGSILRFSPITDEPTPMFYEFTCLDKEPEKTEAGKNPKGSVIKIGAQRMFFTGLNALKKSVRKARSFMR